jgi:predicted protein tyrosine phosphatase
MDPYHMNRLANCQNRYQNFKQYKRVVCVCSAGLLRSPTAAFVLAQAPWNYNTRAVGLVPEFALVPLDDVMLEWGEEFVCMTEDQAEVVRDRLASSNLSARVVVLYIDDNYSYRDPELMTLIDRRYTATLPI